MAGGRIKWTEKKIAAMQAKGLGRGTGANYRPWISVSDVSSLGRSRRVWSPKLGRTCHLLSDVEYNLFLALEWARDVVDIREQYPLDRDVTLDVASQCGIRHPYYPGTNVPTVMTVDLMATRVLHGKTYLTAFNAKRAEEASDERSIAKLEIQRRTMALLGEQHHVVFHSDLPQQKIKNIDWIRDSLVKDGEAEPRPGYWSQMAQRLANDIAAHGPGELTLAAYASAFDARYGVESGTGLRAARILMHQRTLSVDLEQPQLQSLAMSAFLVTARSGKLRAIGGA